MFNNKTIKPYKITLGREGDTKEVISVDMAFSPNVLITGVCGTGKTKMMHSVIDQLANISDDTEVHIAQICKSDLVKYRNHNNVTFCNTLNDTLEMLDSISRRMQKRFDLLNDTQDCTCIAQFNAKYKNNKKRYLYVVIDDIQEFAVDNCCDSVEEKQIKDSIMKKITDITMFGKNAGCFLIIGCHRPTPDAIPMRLSMALGNKVVFQQPSISSSMMILDNDDALGLSNNEFIMKNHKEYKKGIIE